MGGLAEDKLIDFSFIDTSRLPTILLISPTKNEITSSESPAGDDALSAGSDAECRQTDRLNEVIERHLGGQLDYGDIEVIAGWSV